MAGKIKVGVIGTGFAGLVHLPGFKAHPETEVVAICSARRERAEEAARRFGIPYTFTDYREMLRLKELDMVSIVTPFQFHHAMTLDALEAGKHVLCEKPFASNLREAREMYQKAKEKKGLASMMVFEFRFSPARVRMRELIKEGYIGKPYMVIAHWLVPSGHREWGWHDQGGIGTGQLGALGSHHIDAMRELFGEISGVYGYLDIAVPERPLPTGEIRPVENEDTAAFLLRLEKGGIGSVTVSRIAAYASSICIEVHGSEGMLMVERQRERGSGWVRVFNPGDDKLWGARKGDREIKEIPLPDRLFPYKVDAHPYVPAFMLLVDKVVQSIRERVEIAPTFYDGMKSQEVMEAVTLSFLEKRWVNLPLKD